MNTTTPIIEAKNLWREYGSQVVLENLCAKIFPGEFITVVGASGCGKTTFLNMLLGIDRPSRGSLLLDGHTIKDEPGPDRGIVFQRYSVFPHLDVVDNVAICREFENSPLLGMLWGKPKKTAREEAETLLEKVGLSHARRRFPFELSGGMQQRLALAQTLMKRPRILLLDEPFGALDPGIRKDMHALTLELWQEYKITAVMVTHDLKEGFYLGTRLWVFDKTRVDHQEPQRYGATITYDIPTGQCDDDTYAGIAHSQKFKPEAIHA